jgi:hypothetical protein
LEHIKAVIFGLRNLVMEELPGRKGRFDATAITEFGRFISMLRKRGVQPVLFANDSWTTQADNKPVEEKLKAAWGDFPAFFTGRDNMPKKPTAEAMRALLQRLGLKQNEVLYVGNTETDMRTAVNGGVTFLNGVWMKNDSDYGFKFDSPQELARFVDVFFLGRKHAWHFAIESGDLRYYSLAPFSTMKSQFATYSANAVDTAKEAAGKPEFWGHYLCSTMLLTGVYADIDFVCPFPSHTKGKWNEPLRETIDAFAKFFRARYIPDLVVRHTTALQSRFNRQSMNHLCHLDSLSVTKLPIKNSKTSERYKNPLTAGRTVLVIDDICTRGYSIEAARHLLRESGMKVVLVSWLKTINRDYSELIAPLRTGLARRTPHVGGTLQMRDHPYTGMMVDPGAANELAARFELFSAWQWPEGI